MAIESKEELDKYAVRMRVRGDTYREIKKFLLANWANEPQVQDAIAKVKEMEKKKLLVIDPKAKASGLSTTNLLMGGLVTLIGIVLAITLWGKGWFSFISIIMIGAGLTGMTRKG